MPDNSDERSNILTLSVSQLSLAVKSQLETKFEHIRVRGEVGRISRPNSGHIYFDIKDEKSILSTVIWKGKFIKTAIELEEGLEVICTGRLTSFAGHSKYQLIVEHVEPSGEGALMALLAQRKEKCRKEGLFDESRKQKLPYLPEIIGVITSPSGAVIKDILHRLSDRFPCSVLLSPVRVQGKTCSQEIITSIEYFNQCKRKKPDLLIIARGGGSLEDLWAFNDEALIRAVSVSKIPIISAIGHETDTTLIDLVADLRAPTPSAAAEMAVPVRESLQENIMVYQQRLWNGQAQILKNYQIRLQGLSRALPKPNDILFLAQQRLDYLHERLKYVHSSVVIKAQQRLSNTILPKLNHIFKFYETHLQYKKDRLNHLQGKILLPFYDKLKSQVQQLKLLSHESVLERGFALILDDKSVPIRHSKQVAQGQIVKLQLAKEDKIYACVEKEIFKKPNNIEIRKTKENKQGNLF